MTQMLFTVFAKGFDKRPTNEILNNLFNCLDIVPSYSYTYLKT